MFMTNDVLQRTMNVLSPTTTVLLVLSGLALAVISRRIPHRGSILLSNTGKGSGVGLLLILAWLTTLALTMILLPITSPTTLLGIGGGWLLVGGSGWLFFEKVVRARYLRPGLIGYVPILVRYWLGTVERPTVMKQGNTYLLRLGFEERWTDIGMEVNLDPYTAEGKEKLETQLRDPRHIYPRKLFEEAMVDSGNLRGNRNIKIAIDAPAFTLDTKEYQVDIDSVVSAPCRSLVCQIRKGTIKLCSSFMIVKISAAVE